MDHLASLIMECTNTTMQYKNDTVMQLEMDAAIRAHFEQSMC